MRFRHARAAHGHRALLLREAPPGDATRRTDERSGIAEAVRRGAHRRGDSNREGTFIFILV